MYVGGALERSLDRLGFEGEGAKDRGFGRVGFEFSIAAEIW